LEIFGQVVGDLEEIQMRTNRISAAETASGTLISSKPVSGQLSELPTTGQTASEFFLNTKRAPGNLN